MADKQDIRSTVARGFAWEGLSKLAVQVISWTSTIWVARLLSPEDYGVVATSGLFTGVMSLVMEFGIGAGIVTRKTVDEDELNQCMWLGVLASLVLYALLFVAAPFISAAYQMPQLKDILRVAGLALPIAAWRVVPYSMLLRSMNFRYRALIEMTGQFIQAVGVVSLAMHGFGAWSLVGGYLASALFLTVSFFATRPILGRPSFSMRNIEGILHFGVKITGARLLGFAVSNSDMVIITSRLGAHAAGTYSVAFNFAASPLDKIGAIFNRVAFPAVARLQDQPERSRTLLLRLHFVLLAVASPALVGASLVAPEFVSLLLTDKWGGVVPILRIVCIVNVLRLSGMLMPTVLEARGLAGHVLRYQVASALALPLSFFVGSLWGVVGVACAWLIVYPMIYSWLMRIALREVGIRIGTLFHSVIPVIGANLTMAVAVLGVRTMITDRPDVQRLAISVATGVISYVVASVLLVPRTFWTELRGTIAAIRS